MRALCAMVLAANAQASNYRFAEAQDRVVSDEPQGYTQHVSPDFEVQDGIAVIYARLDHQRVARLVATDYAARVYTDVAPLDAPDGKISAGDAWVANAAAKGVLPAQSTTPADRLLLSSARRVLYESVQQSTWLAHDHLGSLTVETDGQGAVIGRRDYAPFGEERAATGDSDGYGFTGQRRDAGGTLHFSFRQLDPATGRWSSVDPLFQVATHLDAFGEATTAYAYVANNSASAVDPTGLGGMFSSEKAPRAKESGRARRGERRSQAAEANRANLQPRAANPAPAAPVIPEAPPAPRLEEVFAGEHRDDPEMNHMVAALLNVGNQHGIKAPYRENGKIFQAAVAGVRNGIQIGRGSGHGEYLAGAAVAGVAEANRLGYHIEKADVQAAIYSVVTAKARFDHTNQAQQYTDASRGMAFFDYDSVRGGPLDRR